MPRWVRGLRCGCRWLAGSPVWVHQGGDRQELLEEEAGLERCEEALMLWCLRGGVSRQGGVRQPGALRNLERPGAGERSGCRRAAVRGGSRPMGEGLDQA